MSRNSVSQSSAAHQVGFTMVELMIVITVATILLVIALPSFADYLDRARLRGAAGDAMSLVADARTDSVQRNRNVAVSFGGADPVWCVGALGAGSNSTSETTPGAAIPTLSSGCDCTSPSSCVVGSQQLAISSGNYNGVTMGTRPSSLTFDGRLGTVSGLTSTSVTLTSPKGKYRVQMTVAPLGQASLCVPSSYPSIPGISSC